MAGHPKRGASTRALPSKSSRGSAKTASRGKSAPKRSAKLREKGVSLDLSAPEHLTNLVYLTCFRGRKFARGRFSRFIQERVGVSEATERHILQIPAEALALFLAREVRPVSHDRAPVNECFELADGGLLEFVGDHMEAAETVARLLLTHQESRLDHVVELITSHERRWLHTLALEARDARLTELGVADLDDVERLFAPWHAILLRRKLHASIVQRPAVMRIRFAGRKLGPEHILAFLHAIQEPARKLALDRLHFLLACQAVYDARRMSSRLTPQNLRRSTREALRTLSRGLREAGGELGLLAGTQITTVYRLGIATRPAS